MILSNILCHTVDLSLYDFDYSFCLQLAIASDNLDFGVINPEPITVVAHTTRQPQTLELLQRVESAIIQCCHAEWLDKRGFSTDYFYSLDYTALSEQDLLDLFVVPADHVINQFGPTPVVGPCFCDFRNGQLVGIGVRNVSTDLDWVAAAKFTFSNFGLFLFGFDEYVIDDEIFIVEGVFDALSMRRSGYNAIAIGNAFPTAFQLACLHRKFKRLNICLDNDFHGWCGSLMVNTLLEWPVFTTRLKDAGEYQSNIELLSIDRDELTDMVKDGAVEYNTAVKNNTLSRNLPYN